MTSLGVMQPYFFPYLGYFSLLKHVDRFILFDPVQTIRHGWINRNRILKQEAGWIYIQLPLVVHDHRALIRDLEVDRTKPWQAKILAQLAPYKRIAPFYWQVRKTVAEALESDETSVVAVNKATLEAVCRYLGMPRELEIFSRMGLEIEAPNAADEWARNICKAVGGVTDYWNPPGGRGFFNPAKYDAAGIKLRFHEVRLTPYDQRRAPFEPGLSILDVLMFNSPDRVHDMLDDFTLD